MRRSGISTMAAALATLALVGCETTERVVPGSKTTIRNSKEGERETREDVLRKRAEDTPEDPKVWFDLGDYYEEGQQFSAAITCYEQMYGLIKQEEARLGTRFTAGAYHLGRAHARVRNYREAVHFLREVLQLQPADETEASLNAHFREAHYLLGAVYYENRQWEPSREHFVSFRELGGAPLRVEPWLARIEEAEWKGQGTIRTGPNERVTDGKPGASATPGGGGVPANPRTSQGQ